VEWNEAGFPGLSQLGHSHPLTETLWKMRSARLKFMFFLLVAALITVSFSFVSDAALTNCSAVPFLKMTGWCGTGPEISAGHFHPGAN
jgi:hypothetical protein